MAGQLRAMTCNPDLAGNLSLRAGSLSVLFARVSWRQASRREEWGSLHSQARKSRVRRQDTRANNKLS